MAENKKKDPYEGMTDEEIALLARDGDEAALEVLLNKYKNFVRSKARSYFLIGADHEDIVQEGMIGLFKAFRDFKPDKLSSFHASADSPDTKPGKKSLNKDQASPVIDIDRGERLPLPPVVGHSRGIEGRAEQRTVRQHEILQGLLHRFTSQAGWE